MGSPKRPQLSESGLRSPEFLRFQRALLSTFSITPYRNCIYGCKYCYINEIFGDRTGRYLEPVFETPKQLERRRFSLTGESAILSAYTDPYPPIERKHEITRACLKVLTSTKLRALVLATRSPLVTRDLDLLQQLQDRVIVSISVNTDLEDVTREIEPKSPMPEERLRAAKELRQAGLVVRILIAPLFKHSSDFSRRLVDAADLVFLETNPLDTWHPSATDHQRGLMSSDSLVLAEQLRSHFGDEQVFVGRQDLLRFGR